MSLFLLLACGITWLCGFPLAHAWMEHEAPPPCALPLAGLSALGPTLAALVVAGPRGELREVFGRWKTPLWIIAVVPFVPMALHQVGNVFELALGGHPTSWFHPPAAPEQIAALVMFSVGEEFGWRGFAHPRLTERFGPVAGSLLLGLAWALWHLMYLVSPDDGSFDLAALCVMLVELPLYSIVIAWFFERSGRSMAVAIGIHMGAHLDNAGRIPDTELRVRLLGVAALAIAAVFAARSLRAGLGRPPSSAGS